MKSGAPKLHQPSILYLSGDEVLAAGGADMAQAIRDVREGFQLWQRGRVWNAPKISLRPEGDEHVDGMINALASHVRTETLGVSGFKILGSAPQNRKAGMPRANGLLVLFEEQRKTPFCVMEASIVSAVRTGAVSALAAEKLAPPDVQEVTLVGAGVNMRTQLVALQQVLPALRSARVWSRRGSRFPFVRQMKKRTGLRLVAHDQVAEACRGASFIISCLGSMPKPVIPAEAVRSGGVTLFNVGGLEFDPHLLPSMNRIVADDWEQGIKRANQTHAVAFQQGLIDRHQVENLAPILSGVKIGRLDRNERIFFCPTGLAFADTLIATRIYQQAVQLEIGWKLPLWSQPRWI